MPPGRTQGATKGLTSGLGPFLVGDAKGTLVHEKLVALEKRLGRELPNLRKAADAAQKALEQARHAAEAHLHETHVLPAGTGSENKELGLVAFGSLARQELSGEKQSDFDYAVVAYRSVEAPSHIQQYRLAGVRAQREAGLASPGRTALFGGIISAPDLVNRIGLEDDTNRSHTLRMLFLEESVAILDKSSHDTTVRSILKRYLGDYQNEVDGSPLQKKGVPRFLLNDIVRYWRTVAVDYQAKRWTEPWLPDGFGQLGDGDTGLDPPKWGLRYLKLRSSRKLAFVGTLISLFLPRILDCYVTEELLFEQFSMPPLARLAQIANHLDDDSLEPLETIFCIADEFAGYFDSADFRDTVSPVEHPRHPEAHQVFKSARALTNDLEFALEHLFRCERPLVPERAPLDGCDAPLSLGQLTDRYLLF